MKLERLFTVLVTLRFPSKNLLLLLLLYFSPAASAPPAVRFPPRLLPALFRGRSASGTGGVALWTYSGTLTDAASGRTVADVEGVEIVRALSSGSVGDGGSHLDRMGDLAAGKMLRESDEWEAQCTSLHRKFFCYTVPSAAGKGRRLLSSFRHRPGGPLRAVSRAESVALYDSAITYVARDGGLLVCTEFGDGRTALSEVTGGAATDDAGEEATTWDFGLHARPDGLMTRTDNGATRKGGKKTATEMPPIKSDDDSEKESDLPKRTKILSFGKDEGASRALLNKYGARESYSFRFRNTSRRDNIAAESKYSPLQRIRSSLPFFRPPPSPPSPSSVDEVPTGTLRYTRYGECPPHYGPGRTCCLDLVGRRVDSLTDAPLVASTVIAHEVPGFASINMPVGDNIEEALREFRDGGAKIVEDIPDCRSEEKGEVWKRKFLQAASRVMAASSLSPSTKK